ncbi:Cu+-exporting ATPase [Methanobrevibacter gottschalkii]|uniref:Cu+-exporting ATPase n=2 Tax=Methanobrevibacter gottschalkii TaxID=190974 RepID=A0A3N5B664_9EURY|nr:MULTISPECIES: HAD family hydrolase [Methanobrevibacter]MCQ2971232.1 HAD family hydrolase [archaeon]OEC93734.1 haloacid dehalogenase [Methanobrevibacter sp. A27]RPF52843.1 Cu+-exporting ATPase [Methanobrevibacter gottschalkii DSM 11977]SEK19517.1 Cu+-exporting ATPase [Methanobrevibacter gottschalkii]
MKKAVVFDNSGTLIERYRVIKDVLNGNLFTDINSLDLIDAADALALVVLQFNTNKLLDLDQNTLISGVIREYNIDFDVSFSTNPISKAEVKEIIDNEKSATIADITDGFDILRDKVPNMELCNGSALIVDMDLGVIAYTITSAGKFFPKVFETIETLKSRGIEIFIASGDRKGAINRLANLLDIPEDNAFGTVSTRGKCEVVSILKDSGYKVMMVGDGINDLLAFKNADVSVLTIEQQEEISPKVMDKTDHIIEDIFEVTMIDF